MTDLNLRIDLTTVLSAETMEWVTRKLDWTPSLRPWMPDGFERHVRVLHPAYVRVREEGILIGEIAVPWSSVSEWSGKPLHATSHIRDLMLRSDGLDWSEREGEGSVPLQGQMESKPLSRLLTHLAEETTTPNEIWMLIWTGYGGPPDTVGLPVELSSFLKGIGRQYVLRQGSIPSSADASDGAAFENPPTFWWPADRSWFVVCDIDASSTYVGGSDKLFQRILGDTSLEVFPAQLEILMRVITSALRAQQWLTRGSNSQHGFGIICGSPGSGLVMDLVGGKSYIEKRDSGSEQIH